MAVYDSLMSPPLIQPSGRNLQKIRIMREDGDPFFAGIDQLLFIGQSQIPGISCGEGVNTSPFETFRYGDTGTFVCIDPNVAKVEGAPDLRRRVVYATIG